MTDKASAAVASASSQRLQELLRFQRAIDDGKVVLYHGKPIDDVPFDADLRMLLIAKEAYCRDFAASELPHLVGRAVVDAVPPGDTVRVWLIIGAQYDVSGRKNAAKPSVCLAGSVHGTEVISATDLRGLYCFTDGTPCGVIVAPPPLEDQWAIHVGRVT